MIHDPKTTMVVGTGGATYTFLNLPWAGIAGFLTVLYLAIQIIGALPKARDAIKELFK
ncbi:hypothetical protein [Ralstonia pseudosolanacearum]|uniref:hypothetical protein n=1 Tax=Ralstonia pseudosolanacearum TaxID=1310165 RepID=UPI000AA0D687|nr:hypothetical protein [Ralstonia pseudosolanacearum]MDO3559165.1 hypothetical protein [Ralstonia pseudosolanacearum]MDO3578771.1 hypothetical protein [Ralstonia pseudosolanacearum]MDO3588300.1 hypothetical protein [Ralstonia pseudosolanacearum]